MKRGLKFLFLISLIANLFFVSADITVSPTTVPAGINELEQFSITVTNTYVNTEPPTPGDANNGTVTQIVFTLPSGLLFVNGTQSSTPSSSFSNTSTVLTWTNTTYVVNLTGQTTFGFSANATALGASSITVISTFANTSTASSGLSASSEAIEAI